MCSTPTHKHDAATLAAPCVLGKSRRQPQLISMSGGLRSIVVQ
jgi:hypothetical protein